MMNYSDEFSASLLAPQAPIPAGLVAPDGASIQQRYAVYRNNVTTSLIEALESGFPALRKLLGERYFKAMALEHVRQHPPTSAVLSRYGEALPTWLERFPPLERYPWCADLARLELARREAHDAADLVIDCSRLDSAAEDALPALHAILHPATRWLPSRYPILALWQKGCLDVDMPNDAEASAVLVTRPHLAVQQCALPTGGPTWLDALLSGQSLGEAAATTLDRHPDAPIGLLLPLLVQQGAIARFEKKIP